ncbi:hypothetical protein [Duganella vulcania]|uniref:Uncharacterized protein n=1 Tax=Duganella vulcania TaxID=2692166 RepID=A0A845GVD2_9BURK|nr:hypothetical protein [Duganella vulcania]MYM98433.1 hypothetical protein [Duganella vulcania]
MSTYPRTPYTLKCGIVMIDALTRRAGRVIVLQYTPDHLSRTLQVQSVSGDTGDRTEPLRFKGPPVETFRLEAEIDATDQLEFPDANKTAVEVGIFPQLAALEALVTPTSAQVDAADALMTQGAIEIAPMESPLALFVWSAQRVAPVRVTEFSVTEEAFDISLNPTRARVTLALRVLSVNDFGIDHPGAALYMSYLKNKEALALRAVAGSLDQLGVKGL